MQLRLRMLRLETWSRINAVALVAGLLAAVALERPGVLGVFGLGSFAVLLACGRGARFGLANLITGLRLLSVCALCLLSRAAGPLLALSVLVLFALDGLDGYVARRTNSESAFGARFDMETDALFVLLVELVLYQRGAFGAWILITGLLRYAYVLALALAPARGGDMPRTRLGRYAFALLTAGLVLSLVLPHPLGAAAAALGTLAVVSSFARSFYWSYFRPSPLPTT